MADWVYLQLSDHDPVRVPDDPDVIAVFEARGFTRVDAPDGVGVVDTSQTVAEVDQHGVGWLHVVHDGIDGSAKIPNEPGVLDDWQDRGWRLVGEVDEQVDDRTIAELKAEIDRRNQLRVDLTDLNDVPPLSKSGTKQELIDRLREDDQAHQSADGDTPGE